MRPRLPLTVAACLLVLLPAAAFAASPFGVGLPEPSAGGLIPQVAALQKQFYREMTLALKALKGEGGAFLWLGGLSFLYGVVHAAGPGHGKVVIASYLLANRESARRGVVLSVLSAFLQAVVAVGIVSVLAALLNRTSFALTRSAELLELGSYLLIAGLGAWLVFRKGRRLFDLLAAGRPAHSLGAAAVHAHAAVDHHGHNHMHHARSHVSHDHHDHDGCGCGHHHGPTDRSATRSPKAALAAILAVGLRPCSGALVVLVFALAQGIFAAGIAATFLMAAGTAVTVAALAILAVGARDLALRFAAGSSRTAPLMAGVEFGGALLVLALGTVLTLGALG